MTLRIAQVNCVIDEHDREPAELLRAWSTLPLVAQAVAGAGAQVDVVQSARYARSFEADGIRYSFVREPRLRPGSGPGMMPLRLAAAVRRIDPDVIHFHGLDAPVHLWAVARGKAPVLVQDHASHPSRRGKWVRRASLARVAGCAFTSSQQAMPFQAAGHFPLQLPIFEVIESSTHFTPGDQGMARRQAGVFGNPAVLWVGHLNTNKDPLTLLRATKMALAHMPELQLWCAFGSAELLPQVEDMLRSDPLLARHVHLLGKVRHGQVEALCRACDLFILGSHHESCGYALIEALACGLVPIVSDIPSFRAITGGVVGLLVPPGNAAGYARALIAAGGAFDSETRGNVLAHFAAHLSPAALGRRIVTVYQELAARTPVERRGG